MEIVAILMKTLKYVEKPEDAVIGRVWVAPDDHCPPRVSKRVASSRAAQKHEERMKTTKQEFNRRIEEQRKRDHEMAIKALEGRSQRRKPPFNPSPTPQADFPQRRKPTFIPSPVPKPYSPDVPTIQTAPTATQPVPSK
jgi:hypothetical protein